MRPTFQFCLVDLLRQRQELSPEEVSILLESLPDLLDYAPSLPTVLLNGVAVNFFAVPLGVSPESLSEVEVTEWPRFELILLSEDGGDPGECTISDIPSQESGKAPARFGALIYELLGGSRRDAFGGVQFSPLPHLSESANDLLRTAFAGTSRNGCRGFWAKWKREINEGSRDQRQPVTEWRIPRWLLGEVQRGEVLEFTSTNTLQPPVRFSARSEFRIGRSRSISDFPVRLASARDAAEEAVKELSRAHVTLDLSSGSLALRDGNGERRSTNGSAFDGKPLSATDRSPLVRRGILILGEVYRLEVVPVIRFRKLAFTPKNFHEWVGASVDFENLRPVSGAVFFLPMDGHPILRDAVWLVSEIGLSLTEDGRPSWSDGDKPPAAWLLHRSGAFWFANAALAEGEARIDDSSLSPGQIVPLVHGQTLEIGTSQFKVSMA